MICSIRKSIWTDWPALAMASGNPIIWLVHFAFPYMRPSASDVTVFFPASISVLFGAILVWRLRRIVQLLRNGRSASVAVTRLPITRDRDRDRGRLAFVFKCNGRRIRSRTPVHKNRAVLALQPGVIVDVVYDPARPSRAIVKHLYQA